MSTNLKPNYKNGSIVNLMQSILKSYNIDENKQYEELEFLNSEKLKEYQNIILIVVDGLGYNQLKKMNSKNIKEFKKNKTHKITTCFPSTTANCMTAFHTGIPSKQHTITGWFVNSKEIGSIIVPLMFTARFGRVDLRESDISMNHIFDYKSVYQKIKDQNNDEVESYVLTPREYVMGEYSKFSYKGALHMGYRNYSNVIKLFSEAMKKNKASDNKNTKARKYFSIYFPQYDSKCHSNGVKSKDTVQEFEKILKIINKIKSKSKGTNSKIIITADHGLINTPNSKKINLSEDKDFYDCLLNPLSGDMRVVFANVKNSKVKTFKKIISEKYSDIIELKTPSEAIKENLFGLGKANSKFMNRLGDYILIAKNNYVIQDFLANEDEHFFNANHSGLHEDELFVPVIEIDL